MTLSDHSLKVGQDVVCWCTRCKLDLNHVIVAKEETQLKRVQCKTCNSLHNYYPSRTIKTGPVKQGIKVVKKSEDGALKTIKEDRPKARRPVSVEADSSGAKLPKAPSARTLQNRDTKQVQLWQNEVNKASTTRTAVYTTQGRFHVGQLIDHPKFGLGVVLKHLSTEKFEIIFRDDVKILLHNRPAAANANT